MKTPLLVLLSFILSAAKAQQQTFDIITYTPPKGWTAEQKENVVVYSIINKKNNSWCQAGIYKSIASKGSIESDFENEWNGLAVKQYNATGLKENEVTNAGDWKIKAGGGTFIFNNADAMVLLTTITGYNVCVSIIATTNSQDYIDEIEALLESVDLKKPEPAAIITAPPANNTANAAVTGTWIKSGSVNPVYGNPVSWGTGGYTKDQYTFFENGTYIFYSKSFGYAVTNLILAKETGTFSISGNTLTLSPASGVVEAWSKKDGTDKWGKLVSSQKRVLEKTTYQFTNHYFSGIQQWNLVLQPGKPTNRDGSFSTLTLYPNAYYYAPVSNNNTAIDLPPGAELKPAAPPQTSKTQTASQQNSKPPSSSNTGFTFTSTNFDDGWTSTATEDWVEVSKPGIKILIHYPNQKADVHNFNKLDGDNNAWDILVASKYTGINNFLERGIQDYQSITFMTADATEKQTGKKVHIILYKKHYDKGNGRYLEVVADSKSVFEKEFGKNYINRSSWDYLEQSKSWDKLANMQWRNKFSVAANDLLGKWKSSSYASLSYYYVNGGGFAGATATSIADEFIFLAGNKYESDHAGASGVVGNQKFSREVFKGNSTVDNWSITLSNRFQGATEKYDCYFEAIKGGRILLMTDRLGTTLTLVKSK